MSKSDYKAAYRRIHHRPEEIMTSGCMINEDLMAVYLRMTFGGRPNPATWSDISEPACDLVNEMLRDDTWAPEEFQRYVPVDMPKPELLPKSISFEEAQSLSVEIEPNDCGKCEVFIDDKFVATPALRDNVHRAQWVLAIVICTLERAMTTNEPIMREHLLSLKKFAAEGRLEETKIILGWLIDSRRLRISLPEHKVIAWSLTIVAIIESRKATSDQLQTLEGRLNHVGEIIRPTSHFLGRIRYTSRQCKAKNKNRFHKFSIGEALTEDLKLWLHFLQRAKDGFSLNNLVYRKAQRTLRSDSCKGGGLGGYCLHCGKAWRWLIPEAYRGTADNNTLEFLSSVITVMVEDNLPAYCCVVSQTDSTTGEGWLKKSNFYDPIKPNMGIARWFGRFLIDKEICSYSQFFEGKKNIIADILSRDWHLSDEEIIAFLRFVAPTQVPQDFRICPLPNDIVSMILSLLPLRPETTPLPKAPITSETWRGIAGKSFAKLMSSKTSTSTLSSPATESRSSSPIPKASETESTLPSSTLERLLSYPIPPRNISTRWHRPLGTLDDPTLVLTTLETFPPFYQLNGEVTKTPIERPNQKRR
jgi:hypothetical protein